MPNLSDLSLLYLEDEVIVAFDTTQNLNELGLGRVETFYRLGAAEAAARNRHFDVALLDINVNDGQTSKDLGARLALAGTVVIFASGYASEAEALRRDGYHFIPKPYYFAQIGELLQKTLDVKFAADVVRQW